MHASHGGDSVKLKRDLRSANAQRPAEGHRKHVLSPPAGDGKRGCHPELPTNTGLTFPPAGLQTSVASALKSKVTVQTDPLHREKVRAVRELLSVAGLTDEDIDQQGRVKRVFSIYKDMQRLQRSGHSEMPQKILTARFELGRQFEPEQLRRLEGCSAILAIAFAAYVEQVLVAKSVRALTRAEEQARDFILEMNRERGLLK